MSLYAREQQFHDRQALERQGQIATSPEGLIVDSEEYLNHESWIRPAFEMLGNLENNHVLDFGCGHGMASVVFARLGAKVTAFDLSAGYVREAHTRAVQNNMISRVQFIQAGGEKLPFHDHCFDAVWGNAILHHMDPVVAAGELHRVLKPTGRAVFCEPWGENRLLEWARKSLPYPGKERSEDERPMRNQDVAPFHKFFRDVQLYPHQFFSMARRLGLGGSLLNGLQSVDHCAFRMIPRLRNYCRYVIILLRP